MAKISLERLSPEGRSLLIATAVCILAYLAFNRESYLWFLPKPILSGLDYLHYYWLLAFYVTTTFDLFSKK